MYKLTNNNSIIRLSDNACIPMDTANTDYQAYLQWVVEGNTPLPADQPDPSEIMWERIKAERDRRKEIGGYPAVGKWFHSDVYSRTQILALAQLGANLPADVQWKTMDGTFLLLTPTIVGQMFQAAIAQDNATFKAAEVHRVAMEASADPASYDFSTGWPAVFGE
jgi:hypothetical protein